MKRFLLFFTTYFLGFIFLISCLSFILNNRLTNQKYYILSKEVQTIILGHSHAECAYNDTLISNSVNLAQSGESYFYTFLKLRKLVKENPSIKNVVIEVTNNNLEKEMDDWTFKDKYIKYRYPKYSHLMFWNEKAFLLFHNPFSFIDIQNLTFKGKIDFFRNKNQFLYTEMDWGRYRVFEKSYIDSFLIIRKNQQKQTISKKQEIISEAQFASINLKYLHLMVGLCLQNQKKIIFVRSPVHKNYTPPISDSIYYQFLKTNYQQVPFFDLNNVNIENDEFLDFEHVNNKGAKKVSLKLDSLLHTFSIQ